jgi:F420-non-reducing hydrogenase iron-sulfur subunit
VPLVAETKKSVVKEKPTIVAFLCNWCSYAGADMAGTSRFKQPADIRIIRVPCSGRLDWLLISKAFKEGADGVLVSGCHPGDCHYTEGNYYARRKLEALKRYLPLFGIEEGRFEYTWVSASEGKRWSEVVAGFTEQIHGLGVRRAG